MITRINDYEIDDDRTRLDFAAIHAWLSNTYWSPGVPRETVERAAQHSALVVGAYHHGTQVGYLRLVSDKTTFAWVGDVYVDDQHRNKGLALAMTNFALQHPDFQRLKRWMLATRDAHRVYAKAGFLPVDDPQSLMVLRPKRM